MGTGGREGRKEGERKRESERRGREDRKYEGGKG